MTQTLRAVRSGPRIFAAMAALGFGVLAWAGGWPVVTPAERQFQAQQAPGAAAIVLEKRVVCDNQANIEQHFLRVKILRAAGLDQATVKIPYLHTEETISGIGGRTIEPNGAIVRFHGRVRRAEIYRGGGYRVEALEFDLPQARVGSILDYRYTLGYNAPQEQDFVYYTLLPETIWQLQGRLPIRHEQFKLIVNPGYPLRDFSTGLPAGHGPVVKGRQVTLRLNNIPALPNEPLAPPLALLRKRVVFVYSTHHIDAPKYFWRGRGKKWAKTARKFAGNKKKLKAVVAALHLAGSPQQRLRAIYRRVLRIRDLDVTTVANSKPDHSAVAALRRNYATGTGINLTLVALARAAGFPAYWVHSAERRDEVFSAAIEDPDQVSNDLVLVRLGKDAVFLDPSGQCPYGVLLWWETGVPGLVANRHGGQWVQLPMPLPSGAERDRHLQLHWAAAGGWVGTLQARWTGEAALGLRESWRQRDAGGRARALTGRARGWLPQGTELKMISSQGWKTSAEALQARWQVRLPNLGAGVVWSEGMMSLGRGPLLTATRRLEPLYFPHPYLHSDTIAIHLLPQAATPALPPPAIVPTDPPPNSPLLFSERAYLQHTAGGRILHMQRRLRVDLVMVPVNDYTIVKEFFAAVAQADNRQIAVGVTAPVVQAQ